MKQIGKIYHIHRTGKGWRFNSKCIGQCVETEAMILDITDWHWRDCFPLLEKRKKKFFDSNYQFILPFQNEEKESCYASLDLPTRANTPTKNSDFSTYSEVKTHHLWTQLKYKHCELGFFFYLSPTIGIYLNFKTWICLQPITNTWL